MKILKQASQAIQTEDASVAVTVKAMLDRIGAEGVAAVKAYARDLDGWEGDFVLSPEKHGRLIERVPQQLREDIDLAHEQVRSFAEAQRDSLKEFEKEISPGVTLGQRVVPIHCAGCYVPGGRYAHVASALMSVATAKVAGVPRVIACSPPQDGSIHPAIAYALKVAGADVILEMGGVHAVASMARGLFTGIRADILAGPGNAYVAEAKRQLFGEVGIDVFAGPTESAIIADHAADAMTIAVDLVAQAEHGPTSPVWLFTTSQTVGETVGRLLPKVAAGMPNPEVILTAWEQWGEIVLCEDREELATVSDRRAPEHLQVMAEDEDWWLHRLRNYGSLFLGEGSTVTHGDKCSGTNHILPTRQAARYTGGLNVQKFMKILTYQRISPEANETISAVASRISRAEGMEGHARSCDWRLRKYFPDQAWDFPVYEQEPLE